MPVHDALVVPSGKVSIASKVMLGVFRELTGVEGMVSVEGMNDGEGAITLQ